MMNSIIPLIFVRHGQTEWNASGRYQGHSDLPLAPQGRAQALLLAVQLRDAMVETILTSPLRRACETAEIIAEALGLEAPVVDSRLTELAYGAWEGLTQAEIRARWPDRLRQWKRAPDVTPVPDGESLTDMRQRLRLFLDDSMWASHRGGVLVVSHAGPIRIARLEAERKPLGLFRQIDVPIASSHRLALRWRHSGGELSQHIQESDRCALQ